MISIFRYIFFVIFCGVIPVTSFAEKKVFYLMYGSYPYVEGQSGPKQFLKDFSFLGKRAKDQKSCGYLLSSGKPKIKYYRTNTTPMECLAQLEEYSKSFFDREIVGPSHKTGMSCSLYLIFLPCDIKERKIYADTQNIDFYDCLSGFSRKIRDEKSGESEIRNTMLPEASVPLILENARKSLDEMEEKYKRNNLFEQIQNQIKKMSSLSGPKKLDMMRNIEKLLKQKPQKEEKEELDSQAKKRIKEEVEKYVEKKPYTKKVSKKKKNSGVDESELDT